MKHECIMGQMHRTMAPQRRRPFTHRHLGLPFHSLYTCTNTCALVNALTQTHRLTSSVFCPRPQHYRFSSYDKCMERLDKIIKTGRRWGCLYEVWLFIRVAFHLVQVVKQVYSQHLSLLPFADISLEACQVPSHNVTVIILQGEGREAPCCLLLTS